MLRAEQPGNGTWEPIGPGVLRRRLAGLELNIAVVAGRNGVLLVDTGSHDDEATGLLAELAVELPRHGLPGSVVAVVNTHGHFDHCFGNAAVLRAFPDAVLWGHESLPAHLDRWGEEARGEAVGFGMPRAAMDAVEIVPPRCLVPAGGSAVVDLGGREAVLYAPGRGHTGADLVVHVPDAEVLIAGDLIEESGPPMAGPDAYPGEWAGTLRRVLALGARVWLPGHGDVVDTAFVERQLADVEAAARRAPATG